MQGIAGTAMPSFALLPADEIDALVEYVKYLSLRGETEELLFDLVVNQGMTDPLTRDIVVNDAMMPSVNMWNEAENKIKHPPARPEHLGPLDHPDEGVSGGGAPGCLPTP